MGVVRPETLARHADVTEPEAKHITEKHQEEELVLAIRDVNHFKTSHIHLSYSQICYVSLIPLVKTPIKLIFKCFKGQKWSSRMGGMVH